MDSDQLPATNCLNGLLDKSVPFLKSRNSPYAGHTGMETMRLQKLKLIIFSSFTNEALQSSTRRLCRPPRTPASRESYSHCRICATAVPTATASAASSTHHSKRPRNGFGTRCSFSTHWLVIAVSESMLSHSHRHKVIEHLSIGGEAARGFATLIMHQKILGR